MKSLSVAIEEPPPQSSDGRNAEKPVFSDYHTFFKPFFNKLDDHYSSRFQWFKEVIPEVDKIVDFGFGERGAETFALMWALDAVEAVGFDNNPTRVKQADRTRKKAQDFGISVAILLGTHLENIQNYLDGQDFESTIIKG